MQGCQTGEVIEVMEHYFSLDDGHLASQCVDEPFVKPSLKFVLGQKSKTKSLCRLHHDKSLCLRSWLPEAAYRSSNIKSLPGESRVKCRQSRVLLLFEAEA